MIAAVAFVAVLPLLTSASPINKRAATQFIHPHGDQSLCLAVHSNSAKPFNDYNGQIIESVACDAPYYQKDWIIQSGNNPNGIESSGSGGFCMDAGSNPSNNVGMKIWQCYPGLGQQTFYYTDDEHIAVTGGNQCIDVRASDNVVQTYQCTGGNSNQIFSVGDSSTGSTPPPVVTPPATGGSENVMFHFSGTSVGCVTVGHGFIASGALAYINGCSQNPSNDSYTLSQMFTVTRNKAGPITLVSHPDLCLDAGVNPGQNGSPITVYSCLKQSDGSPIPQQNWYYTDDNHLAITGGTQCLDVVRDSKQGTTKPDGSLQDLSTWQCSGGDAQQIFKV